MITLIAKDVKSRVNIGPRVPLAKIAHILGAPAKTA